MESPPRNLGSASHGKLKADQWRTACTVSLVITLVRLWGFQGDKFDILQNFADLSRAVRFATSRSTSLEKVRKYEQYISCYLEGMARIYGADCVRPNHHLALHLIECLLGFGPVHSWWSFPFERLNGRLQRLRTNKIDAYVLRRLDHLSESYSRSFDAGALPLTYMLSFCRGINLMSYISNSARPLIRQFKDLASKWLLNSEAAKEEGKMKRYLRAFGLQDVILSSMDFANEVLLFDNINAEPLSPDDYTKLVLAIRTIQGPNRNFVHHAVSTRRRRAHLKYGQSPKELRKDQVIFRATLESRRRKQKNCLVEFVTVAGDRAVGQVIDIFLHQRQDTTDAFFKIARFGELNEQDARKDPYRTFENLGAKLYYEEIHSVEIVPLRDVSAHIAYCPFTVSEGVFLPTRMCGCIVSKGEINPFLPGLRTTN